MKARCIWDGRMSESMTFVVPPTRILIEPATHAEFFEWLCIWEAIHWSPPSGYHTRTGVAL